MIPTWKRVDYLPVTLASVLDQDLGPELMEIWVIDDPSETDVEAVVKQVGRGRVGYHRNEQRMGMVGNWNACATRARGQWVHVLHEDDLVLPGFYNAIRSAAQQHPEIGGFICRCAILDSTGIWTELSTIDSSSKGIWRNAVECLGERNSIRFPGIVIRKTVYETVGVFRHEAGYVADWDMWRRVAFGHPIYYTPEVLAGYRVHLQTETKRTHHDSKSLFQSFKERQFLIETARPIVPASVTDRAIRHYLRVLADTISSKIISGQVTLGIRLFVRSPKFGHAFLVFLFVWAYLATKTMAGLRTGASRTYMPTEPSPAGETATTPH